MKNKSINIKTIIIVILIGIIISMSFIIFNMKKNNIEGQEIVKEQLGETTIDNSYISLKDHNLELKEKQNEIEDIQNTSGSATATVDKILKDYTAYKNGQLITGTMANNGAVTKTLNTGESYTIPEGYHNGSGKVTVNSLASQTSATATANDLLSGKTAWVNGNKITGTLIGSNFEILLSSGTSYNVTNEYNGKKGIVIATCSSGSRDNAAQLKITLDGLTDYSNYTLVSNYYNKTYIYYGEFQEGTISVTESSPSGGTYNVAKITVLSL